MKSTEPADKVLWRRKELYCRRGPKVETCCSLRKNVLQVGEKYIK